MALDGPQQLELGEISTRIVGYAVTRGEQILELMAAPDCPRAAVELLARCCGDAIEHDRHCVLLHAPPWSPLFEIFDEAGGCGPPRAAEREVYMMRLLDPLELLRRLCDQFEQRATAAHLCAARPGLAPGRAKVPIGTGPGRRRRHVATARPQLLAAERGRLYATGLGAASTGKRPSSTAGWNVPRRWPARPAACCFPRFPCGAPPWDNAPAIADQIAEGE